MSNETLRTKIVMPLGQTVNWVSVRVERIMANSSRREVRPLSEKDAIDTGAEIISEAFIFVVAAAAITNEYMTSAAKAAVKAEQLDRKLEELSASVDTLEQELRILRLEQQRHTDRLNEELYVLVPLATQMNKKERKMNKIEEEEEEEPGTRIGLIFSC